jgi:hypothetical protein
VIDVEFPKEVDVAFEEAMRTALLKSQEVLL